MSVARLDDVQHKVVVAPAAARQVVVAGPGSGKTEVVAARLATLVEEDDLDPAVELLVISFSRAAVRAATRRLRQTGTKAAGSVRTLDALAAQVVVEASGEDVAGVSFDRRVARATRLLRERKWDGATDLRHIIVDEVQDVVGLRAEMLLELLTALPPDCGFTVLGDLAQAIYDFQLEPAHPTTSIELVDRICDWPGVTVQELPGSYRARSREAHAAVALRRGAARDLSDARVSVRNFVDGVVDAGDLDALVPLLSKEGESTAILTETNGEALLVAHHLWDRGIRAVVRRPVELPVVHRWVAETLSDRDSWTRDEFLAACTTEEIGVARWKALRGLRRDHRGSEIRSSDVAGALRRPFRLPAELVGEDEGVVVVSTIHRAKGLEFDNVVLAHFTPWKEEPQDAGAATRATYVALTRARSRLSRVHLGRCYLRHDHDDRWWATNKYGKGVVRWEVRGEDIDRSIPAGRGEAATHTTQAHIRRSVRPGDPLETLLDLELTTMEIPRYRLMHGGVDVGVTSAEFGRRLARRVGDAHRRGNDFLPWPRLEMLRVETVETVAGDSQPRPGVGSHGLWNGVRAVGLARLGWRSE